MKSNQSLSPRVGLLILALAGWLNACDDGASPAPTRPKISAQGTAAPGYAVTDFATDFPNSGIGPIGLAFDATGNLFVGDYATGFLYKFGSGGGVASTATQVNATRIGGLPAGLTFAKDGSLFLARQSSGDLVQLDPSNGTIIRTVASGMTFATGLATDPLSGDLFVSNVSSTVFRISNFASGPGTVVPYPSINIAVDGIAFGADGTLFGSFRGVLAEIAGTNSATPGAVTIIGVPFSDGDGMALSATPGTPFLYINRNGGIITKVDLTTTPPTFTNIFTGGSRGDFVAVGPDGCLYATQSDRVIKVTNADGTCLPPPLGPLVPTNPPPPLPPVANPGGPYAANEGAEVAFNGTGSSDPGGLALTYSWDFGDGSAAVTGATPTHTYADDQSTPYTVTLTVTNAIGLSNVASTTATISNVAPSVSPINGATIVLGQSFVSSGSFADPGQDTWTATVNYGDGSATQALALSGKTFQLSHVYGTVGTYSVTVTVTDDDGAAGVGQATVVILPPPLSVGKVTGGGAINVAGGSGTFGFVVQAQTTTGPVGGDLQYVNKARGANVHSVTLTTLVIDGNTAMLGGTCIKNDAPCTFTVNVTDNGEPGTNDTFTITVDAGPPEGGTLRSGNIQIHKSQ